MTVCIACICHSGNDIIGVYDAMVTYGDIEFEAPQQKAIEICKSVLVLVAGDGDLQAEILGRLKQTVANQIEENPDDIISTKQVADLYHDAYTMVWQEKVQRSILAKHGLTWNDYLGRQKELSESFLENLSREIVQFQLSEIQAIIAGVDGPKQAAHLFLFAWNSRIGDYDLTCQDAQVFACIGSGSNLANAVLIGLSFNSHCSFLDAYFLCYAAKKRAELAPGVGKKTRKLHIVDEASSAVYRPPISEYVDGIVEKYYERMIKEQKKSVLNTRSRLEKEVLKTFRQVREELKLNTEVDDDYDS